MFWSWYYWLASLHLQFMPILVSFGYNNNREIAKGHAWLFIGDVLLSDVITLEITYKRWAGRRLSYNTISAKSQSFKTIYVTDSLSSHTLSIITHMQSKSKHQRPNKPPNSFSFVLYVVCHFHYDCINFYSYILVAIPI